MVNIIHHGEYQALLATLPGGPCHVPRHVGRRASPRCLARVRTYMHVGDRFQVVGLVWFHIGGLSG